MSILSPNDFFEMLEIPPDIRRAREKWRFNGRTRPDFAFEPGEGQESVWDYPRPPRLALDDRRVEVFLDGDRIAATQRAYRILETASPPTFYLPPDDVRTERLEPAPGGSVCEWKGPATYWSVRTGTRLVPEAAWSYPTPFPGFEAIAGYLSFYPGKLECRVAGERVDPQPGGFYGGWVTSDVVGPFKGTPGTTWW